jgi:hypothetical protein
MRGGGGFSPVGALTHKGAMASVWLLAHLKAFAVLGMSHGTAACITWDLTTSLASITTVHSCDLCTADQRLSQARPIQNEINIRTKSENKRRTDQNISVANMRPQPELATVEVQRKLVASSLTGCSDGKHGADCPRVIGMCKCCSLPSALNSIRPVYITFASTQFKLLAV